MDGAEVPAEQEAQEACPSLPSVDLPASHGSHVWARVAPIASEALPWPQRIHAAPAAGLYVP